MRKLLLLTTVLVSVVLGCTKIDVERDNYGNEGIIFYAGSEEDTKVTYDPDTYKFSWIANKDEVGITGQVGTAEPYVYSVVYTPDKSSTSAILMPKTTSIDWSNETDEHTFYAYYPTKSKVATYENNDVVVNFPFEAEQTQLETNNSDHMGSYTFATSSRKATPPSGSKVGFNFKHHVAFFEFHVSAVANNTMTIQKIEVTAAEPVGASAVQYSFKDNAVKLVSGEYTTATLNFTKAMPVTTALQKGWLAIAPGTYAKLTFTVTYTDGTTQVIEKTPKAALKAGSVNTVPITAEPTKGGIDPEPANLCKSNKLYARYAQIGGITVGSYSKTVAANVDYTDDTANIIPLAKGDQIKVAIKNNAAGSESTTAIAWVDWNKDGILTEAETVGYQAAKAVAANSTDEEYLVFNIDAPEGVSNGKYLIRFGTNYKENKGGCDDTDSGRDESRTIYDLAIQYDSKVNPNAPAKARIAAADGLQVAFDKDATASIVKTINISLTKTSETSTTINLAATTDAPLLTGVLSTNSITIPAGETTATATITFAPTTFILDTKANITITATSTDVDVIDIAKNVTYLVKGPVGKQDVKLSYEIIFPDWTPFEGVITFEDDNNIEILAYATTEVVLDPQVPFDYEVTGTLSKDDFIIEFATPGTSCMVYKNANYGYNNIFVKPSAKGKTGTFRFICEGATFADGQEVTTFTEIK